jgi:hypothetical protein
MRQELSLPILEQFHEWLLEQQPEVLPKSPMGEAIAYALNNWEALRRYTDAGFLTIDNNATEREVKRIVIGRKKLPDHWVATRRPDGGGALQLHVHVPAAGRRAVGVPARRADALAGDAGWATR